MRNLLILGGIGILGTAAWTVCGDAAAQGYGSTHGSPAYSSLVVYPRYIQYHTVNIWGIFPIQLEIQPSLFPGQPELGTAAPGIPAGGVLLAGPGSMVGDHQGVGDHHGGAASHTHAHHVVHGERGRALIPQATAPVAPESDQAGAATAQPNTTASPWSPRPPGAAGPGRRLPGRSGPGLPGPGRPASPRG
jgi:hypothetical protein